jgi:drug/metabolite transporter (DMT)-like permease
MKKERIAALSLLASNILFIIASYVLKDRGASSSNSIFALGAANVICGGCVLVLNRKQRIRFVAADVGLLILRSAAFVFTYFLFIFWKDLITVQDLIIAETAAPFLSMYLSSKMMRAQTQGTSGVSLVDLAKFLLLISIPILSRSGAFLDSNMRLLLLALITFLFVINQVTSRLLSKRVPIQWTIGRSTALSGIGLIIMAFLFGFSSERVAATLMFIKVSTLTGLLFAIQISFLYGLKYCSGRLAAFSISTSVPLSILCALLIGENEVRSIVVSIAGVYCLVVLADSKSSELPIQPASTG